MLLDQIDKRAVVCVFGDIAYIAQSHHDYIYIDDYIGGLEIVNVSNPQNPNQINKLLQNDK